MAWTRGAALGLAVAALVALGACGGRTPSPAGLAAALDDAVAAPAFGDADPVAWRGGGPDAYPVHGIDVSRYQAPIDWPRARASGVSFAFIKATEGGDRVDAGFLGHWRGAGDAGVRRGAYHFYYFCRSSAVQARWFIANVPRARGALPPVVDLEWNPQSPTCTYRPPPEVVRAEALAFMDILEDHYRQRPIIYTDPAFWERNELWRLRGEEVWLRSTARHPSEAYDGAPWLFWQYSGTGLVPGVAGPVDLNAFAGSAASWRAWLAARAP